MKSLCRMKTFRVLFTANGDFIMRVYWERKPGDKINKMSFTIHFLSLLLTFNLILKICTKLTAQFITNRWYNLLSFTISFLSIRRRRRQTFFHYWHSFLGIIYILSNFNRYITEKIDSNRSENYYKYYFL